MNNSEPYCIADVIQIHSMKDEAVKHVTESCCTSISTKGSEIEVGDACSKSLSALDALSDEYNQQEVFVAKQIIQASKVRALTRIQTDANEVTQVIEIPRETVAITNA